MSKFQKVTANNFIPLLFFQYSSNLLIQRLYSIKNSLLFEKFQTKNPFLTKKMKPSQQNGDIELQSLQRLPVSTKTNAQQYLQSLIKAPYKTHNAYTNSISLPQLLTIILFILQVTLHSIYIAPLIYKINNEILNFIFILNYFIMCAVIGHFLYLSMSDPVDSLIVDLNQKETVEKNSKQETVFCVMCQKTVKKTSRHCYDCGRCTEEYDHHCVCLNNCIGLGNYQEFIRLLLFDQIFNVLITLQGIWMLAKAQNANFGALIFLIILSLLIFIAVVLLLVFHCYLNCFIRKPTYQFFKDWRKRKYEVGDKIEYKNYVGDGLGTVIKDHNNKVKEEEIKQEIGH